MILIVIPSPDTVHTDFALALCNLVTYTTMHNIPVRLMSPRGSILPVLRNVGAKECLSDKDYSHMLFLDSDMAFPADTLLRLMHHDRDVVGATYARRIPSEGKPVSKVPDGFSELRDSAGLIKVDELPTGCMLINRRVIDDLATCDPLFEFGWDTDNNKVVGEDIMFCRKAIAAGYSVWCEPKLSHQIVHLGTVGFTLQ
jgi:hypothetical protein